MSGNTIGATPQPILSGSIGVQAPVQSQPANEVAQPTTPQLLDGTPRSLAAANSVRVKHDEFKVETNKGLEVKISRLASESVAAHHTADALLKSVFKLAESIDGEKSARLNLLSTYLGADGNPSLTVIGQNDAGAFNKLVNDVLHDRATPAHQKGDDGAQAAHKNHTPQSGHSSDQAWTLREKGTAFFNLTNSSYFNGLIQKVKTTAEQAVKDQEKGLTNSPAQQKLGQLRQQVDVDRILKLKTSTADPSNPHARAGLEIYTGINESGKVQTTNPELYAVKDKDGNLKKNPASLQDAKGGSLSAHQNDYRAAPQIEDKENPDKPRAELTDKGRVFTTAQKLRDEGRLSDRELRLAQSSPRNHVSRTDYQFRTNDPVKSNQDLSLDKVIVQRGNGFAVWNVKKDSAFAKDSEAHAKPTVAGPSGTTDRFMTAARLLGPAAVKDLGLEGAKADNQLKELTRWLATGYLVDDNHHSMVEVSLGAANHGLDAQWGVELYVSPFSENIQSSKFNISSENVVVELYDMPEVKVHRDYERTLKAGLEWKEGSTRVSERAVLNARGDITLTTDKPASDVGSNTAVVNDRVADLAKRVEADRAKPVEITTSANVPQAPQWIKV